jgi:hypothetical protein
MIFLIFRQRDRHTNSPIRYKASDLFFLSINDYFLSSDNMIAEQCFFVAF